jgi:hypothetical protein
MEIKQFNRETKGFFKAIANGKEAGHMTYSWAGSEKFIIDHTEVNPDFKGQGVGNQLVDAAVAYARTNGFKIIPLCPFVKSVFDKRTDYQDVIA